MRYSMQLKSSNLKAASYDDELRELTVHFHNGKSYQYQDVPQAVFTDLGAAQSAGQFFNSNIKPTYEWTKLTEKEP